MVLLVDFDNSKIVSEPLAISALYAFLKKYSIEVEMYYSKLDDVQFAYKLEKTNPQIVGISVTTRIYDKTKDDLFEIVNAIKRFNARINVVVGGHLPSTDPYSFLLPGIDAVIIGYGEIAFLDYIINFINGSINPKIQGVIYSKTDTIEGSKFVSNLDELPYASRAYLPLVRKKLNSEPIVQILSSRGCVGNCSFCSIRSFMNNANVAYMERSVDSIVNEMEILYNDYGARNFVFEDDNFFRHNNIKQKSIQLYEKIEKKVLKDLTIRIQIKPDFVDSESIEILKKIGVKRIFIGIENFNDQDLTFYNKGLSSRNIHACINILLSLGFSFELDAEYRVYGGYICFNPYSTIETLLNSSKWLRHYGIPPKKLLNKVTLYKNTKMQCILEKDKMINSDGTINFKYDEVAKKYYVLSDLFKTLSLKREQYRFPLKFLREHSKSLHKNLDIEKTKSAVAYYDNLMFDSFDKIVCASENYDSIVNEYEKLSHNFDNSIGIYSLILEIYNDNRQLVWF